MYNDSFGSSNCVFAQRLLHDLKKNVPLFCLQPEDDLRWSKNVARLHIYNWLDNFCLKPSDQSSLKTPPALPRAGSPPWPCFFRVWRWTPSPSPGVPQCHNQPSDLISSNLLFFWGWERDEEAIDQIQNLSRQNNFLLGYTAFQIRSPQNYLFGEDFLQIWSAWNYPFVGKLSPPREGNKNIPFSGLRPLRRGGGVEWYLIVR